MKNKAFIILLCTLLIGCNGKQQHTKEQNKNVFLPSDTFTYETTFLESIYVPVYSHINHKKSSFIVDLTTTLSIRNTDLEKNIKINKIHYYNTQGELIKDFTSESLVLKPMASAEYIINEDDKSGGSGANFILELEYPEKASKPLCEAIMVSTASGQGISFSSRGISLSIKKRVYQE